MAYIPFLGLIELLVFSAVVCRSGYFSDAVYCFESHNRTWSHGKPSNLTTCIGRMKLVVPVKKCCRRGSAYTMFSNGWLCTVCPEKFHGHSEKKTLTDDKATTTNSAADNLLYIDSHNLPQNPNLKPTPHDTGEFLFIDQPTGNDVTAGKNNWNGRDTDAEDKGYESDSNHGVETEQIGNAWLSDMNDLDSKRITYTKNSDLNDKNAYNVMNAVHEAKLKLNMDGGPPVEGGWSHWSTWTPSYCTGKCGVEDPGSLSRYRSCNDPEPRFGGHYCKGDPVEIQSCPFVYCVWGPCTCGRSSCNCWGEQVTIDSRPVTARACYSESFCGSYSEDQSSNHFDGSGGSELNEENLNEDVYVS